MAQPHDRVTTVRPRRPPLGRLCCSRRPTTRLPSSTPSRRLQDVHHRRRFRSARRPARTRRLPTPPWRCCCCCRWQRRQRSPQRCPCAGIGTRASWRHGRAKTPPQTLAAAAADRFCFKCSRRTSVCISCLLEMAASVVGVAAAAAILAEAARAPRRRRWQKKPGAQSERECPAEILTLHSKCMAAAAALTATTPASSPDDALMRRASVPTRSLPRRGRMPSYPQQRPSTHSQRFLSVRVFAWGGILANALAPRCPPPRPLPW